MEYDDSRREPSPDDRRQQAIEFMAAEVAAENRAARERKKKGWQRHLRFMRQVREWNRQRKNNHTTQ